MDISASDGKNCCNDHAFYLDDSGSSGSRSRRRHHRITTADPLTAKHPGLTAHTSPLFQRVLRTQIFSRHAAINSQLLTNRRYTTFWQKRCCNYRIADYHQLNYQLLLPLRDMQQRRKLLKVFRRQHRKHCDSEFTVAAMGNDIVSPSTSADDESDTESPPYPYGTTAVYSVTATATGSASLSSPSPSSSSCLLEIPESPPRQRKIPKRRIDSPEPSASPTSSSPSIEQQQQQPAAAAAAATTTTTGTSQPQPQPPVPLTKWPPIRRMELPKKSVFLPKPLKLNAYKPIDRKKLVRRTTSLEKLNQMEVAGTTATAVEAEAEASATLKTGAETGTITSVDAGNHVNNKNNKQENNNTNNNNNNNNNSIEAIQQLIIDQILPNTKNGGAGGGDGNGGDGGDDGDDDNDDHHHHDKNGHADNNGGGFVRRKLSEAKKQRYRRLLCEAELKMERKLKRELKRKAAEEAAEAAEAEKIAAAAAVEAEKLAKSSVIAEIIKKPPMEIKPPPQPESDREPDREPKVDKGYLALKESLEYDIERLQTRILRELEIEHEKRKIREREIIGDVDGLENERQSNDGGDGGDADDGDDGEGGQHDDGGGHGGECEDLAKTSIVPIATVISGDKKLTKNQRRHERKRKLRQQKLEEEQQEQLQQQQEEEQSKLMEEKQEEGDAVTVAAESAATAAAASAVNESIKINANPVEIDGNQQILKTEQLIDDFLRKHIDDDDQIDSVAVQSNQTASPVKSSEASASSAEFTSPAGSPSPAESRSPAESPSPAGSTSPAESTSSAGSRSPTGSPSNSIRPSEKNSNMLGAAAEATTKNKSSSFEMPSIEIKATLASPSPSGSSSRRSSSRGSSSRGSSELPVNLMENPELAKLAEIEICKMMARSAFTTKAAGNKAWEMAKAKAFADAKAGAGDLESLEDLFSIMEVFSGQNGNKKLSRTAIMNNLIAMMNSTTTMVDEDEDEEEDCDDDCVDINLGDVEISVSPHAYTILLNDRELARHQSNSNDDEEDGEEGEEEEGEDDDDDEDEEEDDDEDEDEEADEESIEQKNVDNQQETEQQEQEEGAPQQTIKEEIKNNPEYKIRLSSTSIVEATTTTTAEEEATAAAIESIINLTDNQIEEAANAEVILDVADVQAIIKTPLELNVDRNDDGEQKEQNKEEKAQNKDDDADNDAAEEKDEKSDPSTMEYTLNRETLLKDVLDWERNVIEFVKSSQFQNEDSDDADADADSDSDSDNNQFEHILYGTIKLSGLQSTSATGNVLFDNIDSDIISLTAKDVDELLKNEALFNKSKIVRSPEDIEDDADHREFMEVVAAQPKAIAIARNFQMGLSNSLGLDVAEELAFQLGPIISRQQPRPRPPQPSSSSVRPAAMAALLGTKAETKLSPPSSLPPLKNAVDADKKIITKQLAMVEPNNYLNIQSNQTANNSQQTFESHLDGTQDCGGDDQDNDDDTDTEFDFKHFPIGGYTKKPRILTSAELENYLNVKPIFGKSKTLNKNNNENKIEGAATTAAAAVTTAEIIDGKAKVDDFGPQLKFYSSNPKGDQEQEESTIKNLSIISGEVAAAESTSTSVNFNKFTKNIMKILFKILPVNVILKLLSIWPRPRIVNNVVVVQQESKSKSNRLEVKLNFIHSWIIELIQQNIILNGFSGPRLNQLKNYLLIGGGGGIDDKIDSQYGKLNTWDFINYFQNKMTQILINPDEYFLQFNGERYPMIELNDLFMNFRKIPMDKCQVFNEFLLKNVPRILDKYFNEYFKDDDDGDGGDNANVDAEENKKMCDWITEEIDNDILNDSIKSGEVEIVTAGDDDEFDGDREDILTDLESIENSPSKGFSPLGRRGSPIGTSTTMVLATNSLTRHRLFVDNNELTNNLEDAGANQNYDYGDRDDAQDDDHDDDHQDHHNHQLAKEKMEFQRELKALREQKCELEMERMKFERERMEFERLRMERDFELERMKFERERMEFERKKMQQQKLWDEQKLNGPG